MHCITGRAPFMLHSHYYLPELARIKSYLQSTSTEKYLEKHNKKLRPPFISDHYQKETYPVSGRDLLNGCVLKWTV